MPEPSSETPAVTVGLRSPSFVGYLVMGFLTAVNDSMFRWLIVPIAKYRIGSIPGISDADRQANESLVLAVGLGSFILPTILFAPWSGWIADRFSKRSAIVWLKLAEVVIMMLGIVAIWQGNLPAMFSVLFLTGAQSALLSTAKYGIIPEIVPREQLSSANGVTGLITLIAVIVGTVAGNALYVATSPDGLPSLWISAVAVMGVALAGLLGSLWIAQVAPANPGLAFPVNPLACSWRDIQLLTADRAILRVTLGIAFFWSLAALAQLNIDTFVINRLHQTQSDVGIFLAILSLGVGGGSVLAGWWSGGRVELGMVPLGTLIMSLACAAAFFSGQSGWMFGISLALIGAGGGLFNVPLNAYLQDRSPRESLGAILAAGNQITSVGILAVSFAFPVLRTQLGCTPDEIFLIAGIGTLPILIYTVCLIPQATIRFIVWLLTHTVYRVRIHGKQNIPEQGGALLVANHVSWIDGVLLLLASSRPIRMIAYADYVKGGAIGWLAKLFEIIPIKSSDGPKALVQSLNTARQALIDGELVCIFAEGQISRTGELLKFERGMVKILKGTHAPVLPVYLDELWGSIFSYEGGRFFWKKPKYWPYPVTINFGQLMSHESATDVDIVRQAVLDLRDASAARRAAAASSAAESVPALAAAAESQTTRALISDVTAADAPITGPSTENLP